MPLLRKSSEPRRVRQQMSWASAGAIAGDIDAGRLAGDAAPIYLRVRRRDTTNE
jgi:hypothetical protein